MTFKTSVAKIYDIQWRVWLTSFESGRSAGRTPSDLSGRDEAGEDERSKDGDK